MNIAHSTGFQGYQLFVDVTPPTFFSESCLGKSLSPESLYSFTNLRLLLPRNFIVCENKIKLNLISLFCRQFITENGGHVAYKVIPNTNKLVLNYTVLRRFAFIPKLLEL